ncbi:trehalose operon repressor [Enterococcus sp. DIV0242_7C1]|uniref:Trehalose operon repressor n=1 Tax=Candidatus Enterococcus dunnyi TaxID=1834192 RepID=A0A200J0R5_9ENTE|nr:MULTISPECIES: trehalose operon repressor [unclassified Enterococcus]MBO0469970.1 trehalose operon repressor [Enterococcus sp. DIV0242_7C1]MCA5014139.1 trehalose operon repressor [Enterococcus sp. S23]MCA5017641.1 trehalose operon repressor [Enterococcus sp. S22(2020)]OUZ30411.1 trehalose operon repressor [Enterococcus sp. 9D6_DIV0238]
MNKFHDIFLELEKGILEGDYPPGTLLPSENQLVEHYSVSRETIRKALNLLINAGYIQKKQGKGSIVLNVRKFDFPISGVISYKELQKAQQIHSVTKVVELKEEKVDDALARLTGWKKDAAVWRLVRQREIDGEVVIIDIDYLLKEIIAELPEERAADSIYDYFENDLGLEISYAQKEITVEAVTENDQRLMDLNEDTYIVVVRSVVSLEDTRCFEYTESRHRLDKFKFVDFARRRKA